MAKDMTVIIFDGGMFLDMIAMIDHYSQHDHGMITIIFHRYLKIFQNDVS